MKTITKTYKLYEYSELEQTAKDKAVQDMIDFYLEQNDYECMPEFVQKTIDEMDKMRTWWFTAGEIYNNYRDEVENDILINEHLYFRIN